MSSKPRRTEVRTSKNDNDSRKTFSVYLAGDLWTHKDLIGNALLADYVKKVSRGRYACVLPQNLESPVNRDVDIRNVDLKHVLTSDMAIFNFDGSNLDSGTVVEFIYAKMLDIPCVLFRTDFRSAGEGNHDQEPWNLMATHWPRSRVLKLNGMSEYQKARSGNSIGKTIGRLYREMAKQLTDALDAVRLESPLADGSRQSEIFKWALEFPGSGYGNLFSQEEVSSLIAEKRARGLLKSA